MDELQKGCWVDTCRVDVQVQLPDGLVAADTGIVQLISNFHGGHITGMAAVPGVHRVLTASMDGSLRTWNCRCCPTQTCCIVRKSGGNRPKESLQK